MSALTVLLIFLALSAFAFGIARGLFARGARDGDRLGDASVAAVGPDESGRSIAFRVLNPGPQPVLIAAAARRRGVRLRGEAGPLVSVPRRTLHHKLLPGQHTVIWAIPAGRSGRASA